MMFAGNLSPSLGVSLALLLAGCGDDATCRRPFAGDPAQAPVASLFVLQDRDGGVDVIEPREGDAVPLRIPQQGGFVVYAGAKLKNMDSCGVTLSAQLEDVDTGLAASNRDIRQADLEPAPLYGAGWYMPAMLASLTSVANVPACPDALGKGVPPTAVLSLTATDRTGRVARARLRVMPTCPHDSTEDFCHCTCGPDYHPGKCSFNSPDGPLSPDANAPPDANTPPSPDANMPDASLPDGTTGG